MGDPSRISRDVKGLVADFREELKLRDPWDREIDIQFKRGGTRTSYLTFRLLDKPTRIDPVRNNAAANKNVVENRKILQKFLAFLAAEGTFWSGVALRLVREHGLDEAKRALNNLGMDTVEFENRESLARRGAEAEQPPEAAPPKFPPPSPEHRSNKLLAIFRTLIFLGDLARYREQYGTHPSKSGNENNSGRRPRGGRRGKDKANDAPPEKRYAKAEAYYLQARLLLPDYGNPFNQLAIVYSYQHDLFGAALNYYRALCVRRPFPTAKDNLIRTLAKCLEADREMWRIRRAKEASGEKEEKDDESSDLETKFKQDVVLLHALWAGKCRPAKLARHTHNVLASFASLTVRRLLPAATLVQVLVLVLGALWKARMFRDSKSKGKGKSTEESSPETRIVAHILALCTVLLEIGTKEMEDAGGIEDGSGALPEKITGTFRRTLPALRIASKWIKSNVEYIQRHNPSTPISHSAEHSDSDPTRPDPASFWLAWARFSTRLSTMFPLESLPELMVTLEEDVDMRGFAPLKRGMAEGAAGTAEGVDAASVHPNEEQLMRIGDLIVDAKFIVGVSECPVSLVDGVYTFDTTETDQGRSLDRVYHEEETADMMDSDDDEEPEHPEDDRATVSTRTEDDPVRLAMEAVLSEHEDGDEDDEEILYPQKTGGPPATVIAPPQSTIWPPQPSFHSDQSSKFLPDSAPQPHKPKQAGTTAQDLLDRVMSGATGPGTPSFHGPVPNTVHGPTPSFLRTSTTLSSFDPTLNNAFASMSPFPTQSPSFENQSPSFGQASPFDRTPSFMRDSNSTFPTQPFSSSQLSPFPSQRSPSSPFAPGPPPMPDRRKVSDPAFFPSHTRVTSLSGAPSIWTPAPQEVIPSRSGSMRANSMSAGMGSASPLGGLPGVNSVWSPQEGDGSGPRSPIGFGEIGRNRIFNPTAEAQQW
ncbi:Est1 DNA/RNA-binding domain protein [Ceratobasidium sp. AG-Ba]|nr:Est1 DNA/RNA-binding domain protein [Ceratobasidium sp. AG-Ba]